MTRPTGRSKEKEVAPTQLSTLEATLSTNTTIPVAATSSSLRPTIASDVNSGAGLYEKFVLLVNNWNRIKRCINLDKQVHREDPDYISMVSADKDEDLVWDLLSFNMLSYVPCSLPPSELPATAHTVNLTSSTATADEISSLAVPPLPSWLSPGPILYLVLMWHLRDLKMELFKLLTSGWVL